MPSHLYEHILGGLYGQALGDAWAMPAYLNPEQTRAAYGDWIDHFRPGPDDHIVHYGMPAGRFTDDTEQAFALADSIIKHGGVTLQGAVEALINWYDHIGGDSSPYVGPSTRRGVQALKQGKDPQTTGTMGDTNGAAMRVSVVGLLHTGDFAGAVEDALITAIPTHNTDVAFSGAAAVAGAVAVAAGGASLDDIVQAGVEAAEIGRRKGRTWFGASVSKRIQLAVEIATRSDGERERIQELYDVIGSTLAITEAVPAAFGVLVMANGDPIRTATYAAALSGDADTVGAMACAIAGAWRGESAFPNEVIATLRQANAAYDFDALADGLVRLVQQRAATAGS